MKLLLSFFSATLFGFSALAASAETKQLETYALKFKMVPKAFTISNDKEYLNQKIAIDYCNSKQTRLPSAREVAMFHAAHGAYGIVEVADLEKFLKNNDKAEVLIQDNWSVTIRFVKKDAPFKSLTVQTKLILVDAINLDGSNDTFYFSDEGYQSSEVENNWAWTSSASKRHPGRGFYWHSGVGGISLGDSSANPKVKASMAAQCVVDVK